MNLQFSLSQNKFYRKKQLMQIEQLFTKKSNKMNKIGEDSNIPKRPRLFDFHHASIYKKNSGNSSFASLLIQYTTAVYCAAPTRIKYDGKIGFNLYKKCVGLGKRIRTYEELEIQEKINDQGLAQDWLKQIIMGIKQLVPCCVADQLISLLVFITNKLKNSMHISAQLCIEYIKQTKFQYINFANPQILEMLQAKTPFLQSNLQKAISKSLQLFLQGTIHLIQSILQLEKTQLMDFEEKQFQNMDEESVRKRVKKN